MRGAPHRHRSVGLREGVRWAAQATQPPQLVRGRRHGAHWYPVQACRARSGAAITAVARTARAAHGRGLRLAPSFRALVRASAHVSRAPRRDRGASTGRGARAHTRARAWAARRPG